MRIVIDMQGAQTESRFRGIGRYTMAFAQAVIRNRGDHEIILALSGLFPDTIEPIRAAFDGLLSQENIRIWQAPGSVREENQGNESRRETAELVREAFLASLRPDVIHVSSLFEGFIDDAVTSIGRFDTATPVSVILYDLIPLLNPDHYLKPNPRYEQHYLRKVESLRRAAMCLAISEFSRVEGIDALGVAGDKVVNISTAIDAHFQPQTIDEATASQLRQKFGISRPFALYTGGSDERKNLPRLIKAYAALPSNVRAGHQMVLAGKMPEGDVACFKHIARSAGLKGDELVFTGYVTDEALVQLYNLCRLYVFPSWHEGFGLPALEAMACGAPTIGANATSLPEVIGLAEALFDPLDVDAIAGAMAHALHDNTWRERLRRHGLQQAAKFSWDKVALTAIHAWEELHQHAQYLPRVRPRSAQTLHALTHALAPFLKDASDREFEQVSSALALNHPDTGRKRALYVDVSELVQCDARTGIQRVIRAILSTLPKVCPEEYEVIPVYALTHEKVYRRANAFSERFFRNSPQQLESDHPLEPQRGDIFLGLDLQPQVVRECRDYYRFLRDQGVATWFVVYDLLPILLPNTFPPDAPATHQQWMEVVSQGDGLLCISQSVQSDVDQWLQQYQPANRCITAWFHLGNDFENSMPSTGLPDDADDILASVRARPAFLMVGTLEPRKGHAEALAQFEALWQQQVDVTLVIVGKPGWETARLQERITLHPEFKRRLIWLQSASDEFLDLMYRASRCLIAASLGEGFGLPLIEAARFGVPVIARDIPVFREVAGDSALYFGGSQGNDLAQTVKDWLVLDATAKVPDPGSIPVQSWRESAAQILGAILPRRESQPVPAASGEASHRVLMLTPYPLGKPRHGGQLRAASICWTLANSGFQVRCLAWYPAGAYPSDELDADCIEVPSASHIIQFRGQSVPEVVDYLLGVATLVDPAIWQEAVGRINEPVHVIYCEQPWLYRVAVRLRNESPWCRDSKIVFGSQNIEAPMKRAILEKAGHYAPATIDQAIAEIDQLEREAAEQADLCVAVTADDAQTLRALGAREVILAPNGIDGWHGDKRLMEHWRDILPQAPWPLFVASAHPPNYNGFADAVGEALGCIPPGSRLVVAGGVGPLLLLAMEKSRWWPLNRDKIQILGVLDHANLAAVKSLAHAFWLPIKAGGGSNIKTAEALYSGRPVVGTSTAFRGFEAYMTLPGLYVADSPQEFTASARLALLPQSAALAARDAQACELRQHLTWDYTLREIPKCLWSCICNPAKERSAP